METFLFCRTLNNQQGVRNVFGSKSEEQQNGKVCPFYFGWRGKAIRSAAFKESACLKEKCMIWNPNAQDCNINIIAAKL